MRKNIITSLLLAGVLLSTGCGKFLDVTPRSQTPQDILLSTSDGFKDALTGVYIQLKARSTYGDQLTFGTIEHLVSSWDVTANSVSQRIGLMQYEDEGVQNAFAGIYRSAYSTIANVNAILGKIDEQRSIFRDEDIYKMIKGELLAIRAYLHFDMLRLFGPVPTQPDPSVRLAYVKVLSTQLNEMLSYEPFIAQVKADLYDAEKLLSGIDPILEYSISELRSPGPNYAFNPQDEYAAYRYLRMNYYAVKGLQARVALWNGETDAAYAAAKAVVEAKDRNDLPIFRLGTSADFAEGNFPLTPEHVFGLYDFGLFTKYEEMFLSGNLRKGTTTNTAIMNQLYGNTGVDMRESNLWETVTHANQSRSHVIKKYKVSQAATSLASDFKQIPMIRLSEMYLILAETAVGDEAQMWWDAFLLARNLPSTPLSKVLVDRQLEIIKEYRKEFYAEGQAFFAYKRIGAPRGAVLFIPAAAVLDYVVPLPLIEVVNLD